ncbi:MAG: DNA polymerase III subunit beta, partial [Eubacterium sp.]|nr:DNA polymerase III subunit beta [Eubacterium sp.]
HEFVISAKILSEISKIMSDSEEGDTGTLYLGEKKAVFSFDNIQAEMKLLDGKFVPYKDVIDKTSSITVNVEKLLLMESVERASLLARAGKNNLIKMTLNGNVMTISSDSEEGRVKEDIAVMKDGADLTIGFNANYLIDVLKAIDDDEITMMFNKGTDPCIIKSPEGEKYEYLILPVRI